ncbi:hypothetical protein N7492_001565 [Penicillium capsulatum]|uniref:Uncharacterized protein n=1 Tax=Penicillium capsulatum TaxID=69766 RepID=A0A9W9ITX2_9EURO|nr:hypothetical protein N7492_001565 [Penicillium capsulatum]KAJ6129383.1 hypothetical protein N7512_002163 [Penicillium capsulatum]
MNHPQPHSGNPTDIQSALQSLRLDEASNTTGRNADLQGMSSAQLNPHLKQWVVHTGVHNHVCTNLEFFVSYHPFPSSTSAGAVVSITGQSRTPAGMGMVRINPILIHCLHIPGLQYNVYSEEKGFEDLKIYYTGAMHRTLCDVNGNIVGKAFKNLGVPMLLHTECPPAETPELSRSS